MHTCSYAILYGSHQKILRISNHHIHHIGKAIKINIESALHDLRTLNGA